MEYETLLKGKREKLGLSLRQMEKETGISKSCLSMIERNETDLKVSTLVILAKYLKCNLEELIKF